MMPRIMLTLFFWGSCVWFITNCNGQDLILMSSSINCSCELGHGKCAEDGECRCDPGWGGPFCTDCVRMPGCVHGSCVQPWQCTCDEGWTGRFCDKDIDVCEKAMPCLNGATCFLNKAGDYSCLCPESFYGKNCELKTGPCHKIKSPCKNGGICEDLGGFALELSCRCLAGFTGRYCETNMDDCLMRPCANGATCVDGVNRFSCLCPAGFTGRFCTVNLDDCASQPCLNGGRCIDRINKFYCLCPAGFTGQTCDIPLAIKGLPTSASHMNTIGSGREKGGGVRELPQITTKKHNIYTSGNYSQGVTSSRDQGHLLKISVKEVVTQSASSALSDEHFIILLVLGGMTLAAVLLTVGLVLRGHWQSICACSHCKAQASSHEESFQPGCMQHHQVASTQQDCKISFLHSTDQPPEFEKKRMNTEVI